MKARLFIAITILLMAAVAFADSAGPANPTSIVEDQASGSTSWTGYENAAASDNSYAEVTLAPSAESYLIKATTFNFVLPAGVVPVGIVVEIEKRTDNSDVKDAVVKLVKGGAIVGTNKATAEGWPVLSDAYRTHGGATDLVATWGATLTRDEVNASNFGIVVSARNDDGAMSAVAKVDHIRVTCYYTAAAMPRREIRWGGQLDHVATIHLGHPVYRQTRVLAIRRSA